MTFHNHVVTSILNHCTIKINVHSPNHSHSNPQSKTMKKKFLKRLLAAGAAVAVTTFAYGDFDETFDSSATSAEASGGVVWSAGPAGWSGAGCLQDNNTSGGWGGGNAVTLNFSYSSGHQPNIWAIDRK